MQTPDLETKALGLVEQAKGITIANATSYAAAAEFLLTVKDLRKQVNETFDEPIRKAFESHKAMVAAKKRHELPLLEAEAVVKTAMIQYRADEERQRKEQEAALQQDVQLAAAIDAAERGDDGMADALLNGEAATVPVILPSQTPKVEGIRTATRWAYRIVDAALIPSEFYKLDEAKLANVVRAMKGTCNIPGIAVYEQMVIAAGRQ